MTSSRFAGWPERLDTLVRAASARPFAWGTHDCATWACAVAEALCGRNPMRGLLPEYGTADILRAVRRDYGSALACMRAGAQRHGFPEIAPALAQRGDLVCLPAPPPFDSGLGVCLGAWALAPGYTGLRRVPMQQALAAWRV